MCAHKKTLTLGQNNTNANIISPTYYTPTIEEFHYGFEYEIFEDWDVQEEKTWHKQIFGQDGDDQERLGYVHANNLNKMRVKYIDREDLLSLGLEEKNWENDTGYFKKDDYTITIYEMKSFLIMSHYFNNMVRFYGYLKNKSELKRVLQQVGCTLS